MKSLHATHRLDIIAGGDPSDISGLASGKVNSSLGSQWRGRRSQSLENFARDMKNKVWAIISAGFAAFGRL